MQPRIAEVLDHITTHRDELRRAVDGVPTDAQRTKPAPDGWSVVDVLEHLAIVETNVAGMLKKRIVEARDAGLGFENDSGRVVDLDQGEKMRDRTTKLVSGEATRPKSDLAPNAAWDAVEHSRETLRQVIVDADGLALSEVSAPHRIFGSLNVYEWVAFIGNHESRHAAQIREIGASLDRRSA